MKILVTGSRTWDKPRAVEDALKAYVNYDTHWDVELIHGGANGADLFAGGVARKYGWTETRVNADWDTYGKEAGTIRNGVMLDMIPHIVIAFRKGNSPGTTHCINEAKRRNIAVRVINYEEC